MAAAESPEGVAQKVPVSYGVGTDDMITLGIMTEEAMLKNLQHRYSHDIIYTYTGSILVSVNPYQVLPIYTPEMVQKYVGVRIGMLPPHIFAVADSAYRALREERKNQSVIISGESGAGKTEATKLILHYLAAMTNRHSEVEQMILESSPVLEAFGNAKTVRNNNSSRFGKYIEIHFNPEGFISGARIQHFLLEKSRIAFQAEDERNYHVFYQLVAGSSADEKKRWHLGEPSSFHYLNQSGCTTINGVDDGNDFDRVRMALSSLGINSVDQENIFCILSAILNLGNVTFSGAGEDPSKIANPDQLKRVANLLQVDETALGLCLTVRNVVINKQKITIPLKAHEATDARDALAKALYSELFNWLVIRINQAITKPGTHAFIGVLDIFGFENFKVNSFEQFCINYANEKLQQHFNQHIFKIEQAEYEKEKINWSKIEFKDNQPCLDLIEKRPMGILALLDEECRFPKATDNTFLEKLHKNLEKHDNYEKPRRSRTTFVVKHYAGEVAYEVAGFLEKNRDTLQDDLLTMLAGSKNPIITSIFREKLAGGEEARKKAPTVGGFFKNSLGALMDTLNATSPYFVRCIKPNTLKQPNNFDPEMVQAQLRYAGMMETVRIRKLGYPVRFPIDEFWKRYRVTRPGFKEQPDLRATCTALLHELKLDIDQWQMGLTKVFMRDSFYGQLEDIRNEALRESAIHIQAWWRMVFVRRYYLEVRRAVIAIQKTGRMFIARRKFVVLKSATVVFQKQIRMVRQRKHFVQQRGRIKKVQAAIRGYLKVRSATIRLQALVRGWKARKLYRRMVEEQRELERKRKEEMEREKQRRMQMLEDMRRKKEEEERLRRLEEEQRKRREEEKEEEEEEEARRKLEEQKRAAADASARQDTGADLDTDLLGMSPSMLRRASDLSDLRSLVRDLNFPAASDSPGETPRSAVPPTPSGKKRWRTLEMIAAVLKTEPPVLISPEEVDEYQFREFAMNNFLSHKTGTFRKKLVPSKDIVCFSKKPIQFALLKDLKPENAKTAVDLFQKVMWYQTDNKDPLSHVRFILAKGIAVEELRDEIYCQVIKQLTKNPKLEMALRGWELFALLCSTFPPSPNLLKYVAAYIYQHMSLDDEIGQFANYCMTRLRRLVQNGPRKLVPCTAELDAVRARKPLVARIHFMDGTVRSLPIDSATTAAEAFATLVDKLGLREPQGFAIYEVYNKLERSLRNDDLVGDALGKHEKFERECEAKGIKVNFKLLFKQKLFFDPKKISEDPLENFLLYHQAIHDVADMRLPITELEAVQLGALRIQIDVGDYDEARDLTALVKVVIPPNLLPTREIEDWAADLQAEHKKLRGKRKEVAQIEYLKACKALPLYGAAIFNVQHKSDLNLPAKLDVAVNIEGLHLLNAETKKVVESFSYSQMENWYFTPKSVKIFFDPEAELESLPTSHGEKALQLFTLQGIEIASLLSDYSAYLRLDAQYAKAIQDYTVSDANLLPFKKGDIITLKERGGRWLVGELNGRTGSFPADHVQLIIPQTAPKPQDRPKQPAEGSLSPSPTHAAFARRKQPIAPCVANTVAFGPPPPKVDSNRIQLKLFAKERFRTVSSRGTIRVKKIELDIQRRLTFTKDPIQESLLMLENENLSKDASEIFLSIMKYMTDYPRGRKNEASLVQFVVQKAIDNFELRDEVYCQLCKQTTQNPRSDSNLKGWELLSLCAGCFLPSSAFMNYLLAYMQDGALLDNEQGTLAKQALSRINRTIMKGERKLAPSATEIEAIKNGVLIHTNVWLTDGSSKSIYIDSATTVKEAFSEVVSKVHLEHREGFALFEIDNVRGPEQRQRCLKDTENLCDTMAFWEKVKKSAEMRFALRKKLFLESDPPAMPDSDPIMFHLVFHQAVDNILSGRHPVDQDEAAAFAALLLQAEPPTSGGPSPTAGEAAAADVPLTEANVEKFLPVPLLGRVSPSNWLSLIETARKQVRSLSATEAKLKYLEKAKEWKLYGSTIFYAEQKQAPFKIVLAISRHGLWILEPGRKEPVQGWAFSQISNWSPSEEHFGIVAGNLVKPERRVFLTKQASEISELFQAYVDALVSERQKAAAAKKAPVKRRPF